MARCLVTGHRGYIGSRLYKRLQDLGHEVMGIDLFEGHNINRDLHEYNEPARGKFHPHYFNFKPEYIFHLACLPRVEYSIENPVRTMENNVLAASNVLSFAKYVGAKRVIYSSSSAIVGDGNGPTNPYGLQKLVSEMECKLYSELYGVETVSLRYFNVFSGDQEYGGSYSTVICAWLEMLKKNRSLRIDGNGEQTRDYVHVDDVVSANIFCMNYEDKFNGEHFDVGTGTSISLNDIKAIVEKYHKLTWEYAPERKGDVKHTLADINKLKNIGWCAKINAVDSINKCFKENKHD